MRGEGMARINNIQESKRIIKSSHFVLLRLTFPVLVIFFVSNILANAVSVIPNEAILTGTIKEYCLTSASLSSIIPEQVLYRLVISVEEVEDVKGYPNFLKGKEGQSVTLYSKEKQPLELFGEKIKALVEYVGDERGGLFWIKHIEIIK
jgi:hypothetical protein